MVYMVSIDTGKQGAAVLWRGREIVDVYLFEEWQDGINARHFNDWLTGYSKLGQISFAIERVPTIPNQSVKTTSKQFNAVGATYAICMLHSESIVDFYPNQWVTLIRRLLRDSDSHAKKMSQRVVAKYFPDIFEKYKKRKKCHDGVCDAICIGMYAKIEHFAMLVTD